MKKIIIVLSAIAAVCSCSTDATRTNDVVSKIKDPVFKAYCIAKADLNGDKRISMEEAASVDVMDISGLNVSRLDGIEYFSGLKTLDCSGTKVSKICLNSNTIQVLMCHDNPSLIKLDLAKAPALEFIFASKTSLKSLDLAAQNGLYRLWVDSTPLTKLNVVECDRINNLNLFNCKDLKEVVLSPSVNRDLLYVVKDDGLIVK